MLDIHLLEIDEKLKKWGLAQMNGIVKQRIDKTLPDITKEVVDEGSGG